MDVDVDVEEVGVVVVGEAGRQLRWFWRTMMMRMLVVMPTRRRVEVSEEDDVDVEEVAVAVAGEAGRLR